MIKRTLSCALLAVAVIASAQDKIITATMDAGRTRAPISSYLYGQFIEQLGHVINHGIWAEMLDDQKFYYLVTVQPPPDFPTRSRFRPNRWLPVGPESAVWMDTNHPCAGEPSPLVEVDGAGPRGIQQGGLAILKGRPHVGHVVLQGSPGVKIAVRLSWGTSATDHQTVVLGSLHDPIQIITS